MNAHASAPFVEDDLDEADFYAGQGMFSEAMGSLRALAERYPDHPLIIAKMRDVAQLDQGGDTSPPSAHGAMRQVERPRDIRAWIEAQMYQPRY